MLNNYDLIIKRLNRDPETLRAIEREKVHAFLSRTIEYCRGDYGEREFCESGEVDDLRDLITALQIGEKVDYWYIARLADQYDYYSEILNDCRTRIENEKIG